MVAPAFLSLAAVSLRPSTKASDEAALAISEVLSAAVLGGAGALVEVEEEAAKKRGEDEEAQVEPEVAGALEGLLEAIRARSGASASLAARETLGNAAAAAAALVGLPRWAAAFAALEGFALCSRLLQPGDERTEGGVVAAARLLAAAAYERPSACSALVQAGALPPIFSWWRRSAWPKKLAKRLGWGLDEWQALQEALVALLFSCCQQMPHESMEQLRLWKKFSDDKCEAVHRTAELWSEFKTRLARQGLMVERPEPEHQGEELEEEDEEADELLMKRLEHGWLSLMQLSLILVWLACVPSPLLSTLQEAVKEASVKHAIRWPQVAAVLQQYKKRSGYQITAPGLDKIFAP